MAETVSLSVQADLRRVMADLDGLQKKAAAVSQQVKRVGDDLDKNLQRNTKQTEKHFENLRDLGRRVADQLRGYFASLATQTAQSLEGIKKNLGLKQQFIDAKQSAMELHDVIRKLGGSLDIANDRLVDFQRNLTKAFSDAGFDASAAGRALQGIAGTRVSGEQNVQAYALTAARLAQAGGQTGQEGEIAKEMANVLRTRGIDQNNVGAMQELANSVRGRNSLEKLQGQNEMYLAMEPSERGKYSSKTMAGLAAVRKEAGPEIDAFISQMQQGWLSKLPQTAQGLGKILTPEGGINFAEVRKHGSILKRLGNDTTASGATTGMSPEMAKGLYAIWKHADRAEEAQRMARMQNGSLENDVLERRGIGENFDATRNRLNGKIQNVMTPVLGKANDLLGKASQSDLGSLGVQAGGYIGAAAGVWGLNKLATALGGKGGAGSAVASIAKAGAIEQLTGQKTVPVYVVNVSEFGQMGGLGGGLADMPGGGLLQKAGKVSAAAAIGVGIGEGANMLMDEFTQGKNAGTDISGNIAERVIDKLDVMTGGAISGRTKKQMNAGSDVAKQIERQNDMAIRDRQTTPPSEDNRGEAAAVIRR